MSEARLGWDSESHRAPNLPNAQNQQVECIITVKELFDQLVTTIKRDQPLQCSDEHKLECAIALLANEALSWWETTTLTVPAEKVTWSFFVEEFKKKYISDQYLSDRRKHFLHLVQGDKPIEKYVVEFYKYSLEIEDFQILVNQVIATEATMKAVEKGNDEKKSN
ncbi:hypothetical protein V6N13_016121 [Hibiscus sabdariffa]